jgi:PKD repeat protein
MLTEPTEGVSKHSSIQTVVHTRNNNGGITVYLVSGRTKRQTQASIVGPSRSDDGQLDRNHQRFDQG